MVQEEIVPPRICDMESIFAGKPSRVERSMLFRLHVLLLSQQSSLQDQQYITGIPLTIRRPTSQVSCLSVFNQNEIYSEEYLDISDEKERDSVQTGL